MLYHRSVRSGNPLASACSRSISATMEDAPAGIPSRCVDHLADLVVGKVVGNLASFCLLMAGLTQQEALQGFIQGGEPFLRSKLADLAGSPKGEAMAEDRPSCQEAAARGRTSANAE